MKKAIDILNNGAKHMQDRAATYDKPTGEHSIPAAITAFNAITGHSLTSEQGWLLMMILKAVRSQSGDFKIDNYEDMAAYAALTGEQAETDRSAPVEQPDFSKPLHGGIWDNPRVLEYSRTKAGHWVVTQTVDGPQVGTRVANEGYFKAQISKCYPTIPDEGEYVICRPLHEDGWSDISNHIGWIARDHSGIWFGYKDKPERKESDNIWIPREDQTKYHLNQDVCDLIGYCSAVYKMTPWEECLISRGDRL